ncbi:MAG: Outer membrane protein assembly factor BamD [Myxococcota bacterium]|nr:Outer membrane protein assembly factor BamD [Myxococcota bacterium]
MKTWARMAFAAALGLMASSCTRDEAAARRALADDLVLKQEYRRAEELYSAVLVDLEARGDAPPQDRIAILKRIAELNGKTLGRPREAIKYYRRLADAAPNSPEGRDAQANIAWILYNDLRNYEEAVQSYNILIKRSPADPNLPEYRWNLINAWFKLRNYGQVLLEAKSFADAYPQHERAPQALLLMSDALALQNRRREAIATLNSLLEMYPSSPLRSQVLLDRGGLYEQEGNHDQAMRDYMDALRIHSNPESVKVKIATLEKTIKAKTEDPPSALRPRANIPVQGAVSPATRARRAVPR